MLTFIAAFICSWFLLRSLLPLLRNRLPDHPNSRSSHNHPTPRGGGVVFVALSALSSLLSLSSTAFSSITLLPLIALPLACIGLLDDRYNISAAWRYVVQLLTAFFIIYLSPLVNSLTLPFVFTNLPTLLIILMLAVAVTAVINFTNFMDGIDGLVSSCIAVSIATISFELTAPSPLWVLVGSVLGFLLWNWSPAKLFMGDVGSTFLGAVFAGLVLQAPSWSVAFGYLSLSTPLLADAFFSVIRRLASGHSVFQPHQLHLFQRLVQAGWSHAQVSLTYFASTTLLCLAFLSGNLFLFYFFVFFVFFLGLWLDQCVARPFSLASNKR